MRGALFGPCQFSTDDDAFLCLTFPALSLSPSRTPACPHCAFPRHLCPPSPRQPHGALAPFIQGAKVTLHPVTFKRRASVYFVWSSLLGVCSDSRGAGALYSANPVMRRWGGGTSTLPQRWLCNRDLLPVKPPQDSRAATFPAIMSLLVLRGSKAV